MSTRFLSKYEYILFPLSLALFEFTVYIANDMVQPAMLEVITNFNVSIEWVPTSMISYIAGGVFLEWLLGPLSDKYGRRPLMLIGVIFFITSCLAILFVSSIEQFMIMRFLQGIALCFIATVGYATIQEAFNETLCIKIIALMANITLIAPLLGPLIGAILIDILHWQGIFVMFSILGLVSFIGLFFFMPETVNSEEQVLSFLSLWHNYKRILSNQCFIYGALAIGCAHVPLLTWIAISPLIIITKAKLSTFVYAVLQVPVFSGLILGNLVLNNLIGKKSLMQLIKLGGNPMIVGLIIAGCTIFFPSWSYLWTTIGLAIYSFGLGITNPCVMRFTLFSSSVSKGTVSGIMGMIGMVVAILGMTLSKAVYLWGNEGAFNLFNLLVGLCWLVLIAIFTYRLQNT